MSPPSRRRGLKSEECLILKHHLLSPPSRRRGLKFKMADVEEHKIGRLLRGGVD